jgi:hypothetical protein
LFVSAAYLGCKPGEVDAYIRASEEMQAYASAIKQVKVSPEYESMSSKQFQDAIAVKTREYMLDGMDVIHEIAMGDAEDAASRKVKLDAAIALRGAHVERHHQSDLEKTLAELNQLYHQEAPRIVEIRQTTMRIETQGAEPRLINP